jgi:hypothetical protein
MVYDQDADTAHVLSDDVARVWQLCDGRTDVQRIAVDLSLDASVVASALNELERCGLLTATTTTALEAAAMSRRAAMKKVAKVGAAAASAPLIYSLVIAPSAAMATPIACAARNCGAIGDTQGQADNACQSLAGQAAGCQATSTCNATLSVLNVVILPGHCTF